MTLFGRQEPGILKDIEDPEVLRMQRLVPASPDRVFRAWTEPDELKKWWGPAGVRCRSAQVDLRVGGAYRIENELGDGTVVTITGEFEEVKRPHLLVYTWTVDAQATAVERVTVRFEEHSHGTQLTLRHDRIASRTLRDQHQQGWLGCLDGLVAYLS